MKKHLFTSLCLVIFYSLTTHATELPVSINPTKVENELKPKIEPGHIKQPVIIEQKAFDSSVPIEFYKTSFLVKRINLEGNTIFLDHDFTKYYSHLIGKETSLATLYEVAEKITNHYRKEGYVLASAFVPEQHLRNGIVKIKIVEGFINKINLEGEYDKNRITDKIIDKIYNIKPFNIKQFERYILLLNEMPGVSAKAVLKKNTLKNSILGGVDLDIIFLKTPIKIGVGWHNNISRYLGNFIGQSSVEVPIHNNLIKVEVSATDVFSNLQLISLSDKITINGEGTNLFIEGNSIRIRPGGQLKGQKVKIHSQGANLSLSHPLIRSRINNLTLYTGLNINNSSTKTMQILYNKDHLRIYNLGINYDFYDSLLGANLINANWSKGLNLFHTTKKSSPHCSKENGNPTFSKFSLRFARMQPIVENLNLYFSIHNQFTKDTLLSSETFTVGGSSIGKGYDPSTVNGDNGYAFTTELRYKLPEIGLLTSEAFSFYDYGKAWYRRKNNPKNVLAISYGGGIRFNFSKHCSANIVIAKPTTAKAFYDEYKKAKKPTKILLGLYVRT